MPGARNKRTRTTIEEVRAALMKCGGLKAHAAKMLGIARTAVTNRVKGSKILQEAVEEAREQTLDLAESKLIENIQKGDLGAICFYLKCQGKHRGYVEKEPNRISIEFSESMAVNCDKLKVIE